MKNANTPASPIDGLFYEDERGKKTRCDGLTKREMMAMHIAAGFAADGQITTDNVVKWSVEVADKLLQELESTSK